MQLDYHGRTHPGKVRDTNEDHFVIAALRKGVTVEQSSLTPDTVLTRLGDARAVLFAVADGVGGVAGGELASSMTVETILAFLNEVAISFQSSDVDSENAFMETLESAVKRAHEMIRQTFGARRAPATTLTMAVLVGSRAYIVHVGDSRAYLLRKSRLRMVTRDQTTGDDAVDLGLLSETQARAAGLFNQLSRAVGAELSATVGLIDLEAGDTLLLCTDGLTKHLSDEIIASTLGATRSAEEATSTLITGALDAGGSDNITVIVLRTG
jgi:protein phosphatase